MDSWNIFYWNGQIEAVFFSSKNIAHLQNREWYSARNSKRLPFIKPSIHEVYLVLGQANLICQGCKKYLARIDRNIHTTSTYTLTHSVDKKGENFRKLHKKILYPSSLVIVSPNWIFSSSHSPRKMLAKCPLIKSCGLQLRRNIKPRKKVCQEASTDSQWFFAFKLGCYAWYPKPEL